MDLLSPPIIQVDLLVMMKILHDLMDSCTKGAAIIVHIKHVGFFFIDSGAPEDHIKMSEGPRQRGFQKSCFVGSFCLCALLGP